MIVIDASAMVAALVGRDVDPAFLDMMAGELDAPHLLDVEVMSVLRGLTLARKLDRITAEQARRDHFAFAITRHEVKPFADRIWDLRHQYTSYDSCNLALAEALDAPLYTCDTKLAGNGHGAEVRVVSRTH